MSQRNFVSPSEFNIIEFLESRGFQELELQGVKECVFGKRVGRSLSLRVYTTIDSRNGQIRKKGSDAIRVELFHRNSDGEITLCGHSQRVNRIKTWKKNLSKRLENWEQDIAGPTCDRCGNPMVRRTSQYGAFWGCTQYPKCDHTVDAS